MSEIRFDPGTVTPRQAQEMNMAHKADFSELKKFLEWMKENEPETSEHFRMRHWFGYGEDSLYDFEGGDPKDWDFTTLLPASVEHGLDGFKEPSCGTTACIAGWVILRDVTLGKRTTQEIGHIDFLVPTEALKTLGLPINWSAIFYEDRWPIKYRQLAQKEGEYLAAIQLLEDIVAEKVILLHSGSYYGGASLYVVDEVVGDAT